MKATELRIGNMVNAHGGNDSTFCNKDQPKFMAKITGLIKSGIEWECLEEMPDYYHKDIEPILLTEEWLLKFGFKKAKYQSAQTYKEKKSIFRLDWFVITNQDYHNDEWNWIDSTDEYTQDWRHRITIIQYVHQLQNLYFALTGKELTTI